MIFLLLLVCVLIPVACILCRQNPCSLTPAPNSLLRGWIFPEFINKTYSPVAVVGNGPVSDADKAFIKKEYPTIVGFNKNVHDVHATILCVRNEEVTQTIFGFKKNTFEYVGQQPIDKVHTIVYFGASPPLLGHGLQKRFHLNKEVVLCSFEGPEFIKNFSFEPGVVFRKKSCPSTGILGVRFVLQHYINAPVHVYGMNGNVNRTYHNGWIEQEALKTHPRIHLHP